MITGDRVKVKMLDTYGNLLYGTVLDPKFLGFAVLVKVDTPVDKRYCYTDSDEVMFIKDHLEIL